MFGSRRSIRDRDGEDHVERLVRMWVRACEGAELVRTVLTVTGPTVIAPKIVDVTLGGPGRPTVLIVELQPGMVPADVVTLAPRIATHLDCFGLQVEPMGMGRHVRITLLGADPLAEAVPRARPVPTVQHPLTFGVAEDGARVCLDLAHGAHLIVQGSTGSGKSVGAYSLLSQLAHAPDVRVTGTDVSGLLLRPWAAHPRHAGWQALGTGDPLAHVDLLEQLVAGMDKTVSAIPPGRDAVELGDDTPLTVVVCEEYPGLIRWLDSVDSKLGKRARAAMARLMSEGRKAGYRVLIITQRADAAIIGAYERSQASHRLSFRVDTADGVKMLHQDVTADVAAQHSRAAPGVGLLSAPGTPLTRLRGPHVDYATYCDLVGGTAA